MIGISASVWRTAINELSTMRISSRLRIDKSLINSSELRVTQSSLLKKASIYPY